MKKLELKEISGAGIVQGLSARAVEMIAERAVALELAPGAVAFKEGDRGGAVFVVVDGEVEVLKRSRAGHDARVAILGPADSFGEMSMVDESPRSATVRALGPTRLGRIDPEIVLALAEADPAAHATLVRNVARDLARRLRVTDALLADIVANVHAHFPPQRK